MKIYVGNLSYNTTQASLEEQFAAFGQVEEVAIINDRETGRPRGFAFVTMANQEEGQQAIDGMNGVELDGRTLTVNEARPKPAGGGGGPRRGGSGGGRW
ncbi:RNA-binding protein [Aeoliella sp. ICT_H6.2]|uniref:RNA-binding protein n=1 Tax=Aeoliella straminimaris TaxID=2954799 RepID=A0A9X2FCR6_9BACT|nr:RNA-binding protein [Aeoliella straminimaris]MCO6046667.1 RNA-binding protein [Aeoliella straminimaris]